MDAAGSAYIFYINQGGTDNWGEVKKIVASDRGANDLFGASVSISGDHVIVGALSEDEDTFDSNTLDDAGSAYLFYKNHGGVDNWGEVKKIVTSNRTANDQFGRYVTIDGDNIIVLAQLISFNQNGTGTVYLFNRNKGGDDSWGEAQIIPQVVNPAESIFHQPVSISGNDLLIGDGFESNDEFGGNPLSNAGIVYFYELNDSPTSIDNLTNSIPENYKLYPAYPNPFNPSTVISYEIPFESNVRLSIYNMLGEKITLLNPKTQKAGFYKSEWNAKGLSSGVYLLRIDAESLDQKNTFNKSMKMILMK